MKDYQTNVLWDLTLTDIVCLNSQSPTGIYQGLVVSAKKLSGTVPDAVIGKYTVGAIVQNVVTGVWYRNTGTTASPVWSVWSTSGTGLNQLTGDVLAGPGTGSQAATLADSVKVYTAKVTLTAAQVKAIVTGPTPFTLVAAPGAGKAISVISSFTRLTFATTVFNFNGNLNIGTGATAGDGGNIISTTLNHGSSEIVVNNNPSGAMTANAALVLNTGSATTVTTGDGTVDVYVTYKVVTL